VAALQAGESVDVIVEFESLSLDGECIAMARAAGRNHLGAAELPYRRSGLAALKQNVTSEVAGVSFLHDHENLASAWMRIESEAALNALLARAEVVRVRQRPLAVPFAAESLPVIRQPSVVAAGLTGAGKTIVILDSGVDYTNAFFDCTAPGEPGCRIVATHEAPEAVEGPSGNDGALDSNLHQHGTFVSAIAASVAPGADLAVVDMLGTTAGGGQVAAYIEEGINWAIGLITPERDVVAINISIGIVPAGGSTNDFYNTSPCVGAPASNAISDAILHGIQPIAATGNAAFQDSTFRDGIAIPACIPGVVSVSNTFDADIGEYDGGICVNEETAQDSIVCRAQTAPFLSLFAPGGWIDVPGAPLVGDIPIATSFAAPHVTGVWAILAAAMPHASNSEMLDLLRATGVPINDDRPNPPRTTPRIDVFAALDADGDEIFFPFDNCSDIDEDVEVCDADGDGFGNRCDCDIDNNGQCNTNDIDPFKDALVANDPVADINCSGAANTADIPPFKALLTEPQRPGPSGLPCAGEPPCN
jgi:hypothetical protein